MYYADRSSKDWSAAQAAILRGTVMHVLSLSKRAKTSRQL